MARLALLVFHTRRCYRLSSLLSGSGASRTLSSFPRSLSSSAPIAPVSYPVKHKDPHDEGEPTASQDAAPPPSQPAPAAPRRSRTGLDGDSRSWTREDARFVKDAPAISPVSYPSRVAPLPEYTVPDQAEEGTKEEKVKDEQLERESRRIQSGTRTRSFFAFQDEVKVPFPTLIVQEKTPQKVQMDLGEAIRLVKANAKRRFGETVEAHVNLGVDPRRGDQMVRGALTLPHGTGKRVRVAVFAEGAAAEEARAAGADIVGGDELIEEIKIGGGKLNFDKCIATPMYMPRLSKIARILGPRGLMPNPKLGSVTSDVSGAVKEAKSGRIDFKIDKTAIVHAGLGKVNFSEESLRENIGAFVHALLLAKPVGLKKTSKYAGYVKNFTISSTMGPGFPVSIQSLSAAADHYNKVQEKYIYVLSCLTKLGVR